VRKLLLNLYIWPAFFLVTALGLFFLPFFFLLHTLIFRRSPVSALRWSIGHYGWLLVRVVPFMAPVRIERRPNRIPAPCVIVANHSSVLDPYLFGTLPVEICFVASWAFRIPVYGPLMRLAGYIDISDGWEKIRHIGAHRLRDGASISIWPEGHRSRNGRLGRFRRGAFQLAFETGTPILPVTIIGSGRVLSPGKRLLSPGRVRIIVHEPIYPQKSDLPAAEQIGELRDLAYDIIKESLERNGQEALDKTMSPASRRVSFPITSCKQSPDVL
jgi:1-acyl-sn-glycerol-3-phosphate acyltransferase